MELMVNLEQSWKIWEKKISSNWKTIELLRFIKRFKGLQTLGYTCEELMSIILHIDDLKIRLRVIKALHAGKLRIFPIVTFPGSRNIDLYKAFKKILGKRML